MHGALSGQLGAIHAMLASGQRSLRLERHTLLLWGGGGGLLLTLSDVLFTPQQFPDVASRAFAWLSLLVVVFGVVGWSDYVLTRRLKRARDETWSFIHRQVLKVWWLLMGLGILCTFATFFFGGGVMIFALWIVLVGLGLYVHGLFSDELVEWVGVLAVMIGIGSLVFHIGPEATRWLAASIYGIGLPLLAAISGGNGGFNRRAILLPVWALAVLVPPLLLPHAASAGSDEPLPLDYRDYQAGRADLSGRRALRLPAGIEIPVSIAINGPIFRGTEPQTLTLRSAVPITLLLIDGVPNGEMRLGDGPWRPRGAIGSLNIPYIFGDLDPAKGPSLRSEFNIVRADGR